MPDASIPWRGTIDDESQRPHDEAKPGHTNAMNTKAPISSKAISAKEAAKSQRQSRLAASLRSNLRKRKKQELRRDKKSNGANKS